MSQTIIDSLVVELGLDPKAFVKGKNEANSALTGFTKETTNSANKMVAGLRTVAAEFAALFLAVKSFKDVVGYMAQLNESTRQLGIDSRNTGESAATLKDLGNAAEIAGGKAQDAEQTILGLQKAIFNAQHGLGWSDQLTEFARLGVDTGVNTGELRPMVDILREVSTALEQQYPDKAQRFQETQVLGLQGGVANLVSQGRAEFERLWREQQTIPQVTPGQTAAAQRLTESYDVLKQRIEAIARQVLTAIEPALEHLFKGIGDFLQKHTGDISKGIESFLGWFSGDGPQNVVDGLTAIGNAAASVGAYVAKLFPNTFKNSTVPGVGGTPYFYGAFSKTEKDFELKPGILGDDKLRGNTLKTLEATAETLQRLHRELGGDESDPDWEHALNAFQQRYTDPAQRHKPGLWEQQMDWFRTQGPFNSVPDAGKATTGAESSPGTRATIAGGKPTADTGTRGGGVTLSIDSLNVYTQATDAQGVANGLVGAIDRKLTITYADGALS